MANKFGFEIVKQKITAMKEELPKVLANQAQTFFTNSWKNQAWEGQPWKEVKRRQEGTPEYKYPAKKGLGRRTRAILVGAGRLRRAVASSIRSQEFSRIRLVVDLPYAQIQNDGGNINKSARSGIVHFNKRGKFANAKHDKNYSHSGNVEIGAHDINMPARTFMKDSPTLRTMQQTKIKEFTDKVWK